MRRFLAPVALLAAGLVLITAGLALRAVLRPPASRIADVDVVYRPLRSPHQIEEPSGGMVRPVTYTRVVPLDDLPVKEKKEKFFAMLLPSVLIAKHELAAQRREVERLQRVDELTAEEQAWLEGLMARYGADGVDRLTLRLQDHPNSIVLAQAALESGWGSSRFFQQGLNVFGVWSFDRTEPRIRAGKARGDRYVYVKRYASLLGSVEDYFETIGRGPYAEFRRARVRTGSPLQLVRYLRRYSELGDEYVRRVRSTIRSNDLRRYDNYRIDPRYLSAEGD